MTDEKLFLSGVVESAKEFESATLRFEAAKRDYANAVQMLQRARDQRQKAEEKFNDDIEKLRSHLITYQK